MAPNPLFITNGMTSSPSFILTKARLTLKLGHVRTRTGVRQFRQSRLPVYRTLMLAVLIIFWLLGGFNMLYNYIWATPFKYFKYPLDIDLNKVVDITLQGENHGVKPINNAQFPFVLSNDRLCKNGNGQYDDIYVLMLIKSRIENFTQRDMIRRTWGKDDTLPHIKIKHVFLLGTNQNNHTVQRKIALEHQKHGDIVQQSFHDTYYNNTYKMMAGFKWAVTNCRTAKYLAFFDDDYYVSVHNMVKMLQSVPEKDKNNIIGYILVNTMPHRSIFNKWQINLKDYEFSHYPPYSLAGSMFIPFHIAERIHIGMMYTKYLPFDDVFVGIIAWKLGIKNTHNDNLYKRKPVLKISYSDVVAVHGYGSVDTLFKWWLEQEDNSYGYDHFW